MIYAPDTATTFSYTQPSTLSSDASDIGRVTVPLKAQPNYRQIPNSGQSYKDTSSQAAVLASETIIINQTNYSESSAVAQHAAHTIPVKVIIIVAAAAAAGAVTAPENCYQSLSGLPLIVL
jgi:hypothetical protein